MIIQGKEDRAVPYAVTDALQKNLAALGTDVTFLGVEGASHTQAIVEKNAELIAFIEKHMPAK
jgi:predicted esterase